MALKQKEMGPRGLGIWGEGLFILRSWGALVIILGELGSMLIVLGIQGALQKKLKNKGKTSIMFDFLKFLWLLWG